MTTDFPLLHQILDAALPPKRDSGPIVDIARALMASPCFRWAPGVIGTSDRDPIPSWNHFVIDAEHAHNLNTIETHDCDAYADVIPFLGVSALWEAAKAAVWDAMLTAMVCAAWRVEDGDIVCLTEPATDAWCVAVSDRIVARGHDTMRLALAAAVIAAPEPLP